MFSLKLSFKNMVIREIAKKCGKYSININYNCYFSFVPSSVAVFMCHSSEELVVGTYLIIHS